MIFQGYSPPSVDSRPGSWKLYERKQGPSTPASTLDMDTDLSEHDVDMWRLEVYFVNEDGGEVLLFPRLNGADAVGTGVHINVVGTTLNSASTSGSNWCDGVKPSSTMTGTIEVSNTPSERRMRLVSASEGSSANRQFIRDVYVTTPSTATDLTSIGMRCLNSGGTNKSGIGEDTILCLYGRRA